MQISTRLFRKDGKMGRMIKHKESGKTVAERLSGEQYQFLRGKSLIKCDKAAIRENL